MNIDRIFYQRYIVHFEAESCGLTSFSIPGSCACVYVFVRLLGGGGRRGNRNIFMIILIHLRYKMMVMVVWIVEGILQGIQNTLWPSLDCQVSLLENIARSLRFSAKT